MLEVGEARFVVRPVASFFGVCAGLSVCVVFVMAPVKQLSSETVSQIIALKRAGHGSSEIATLVGVNRSTVKRWVSRWREDPSAGTPSHKPRSGRPRKVSQQADNIIKRSLESNPRLTARKLREENNLFENVTVRTVSRRVNELGYSKHKPLKKPLLTKRQKAKRLAFAEKYLSGWEDDKWLEVLWSDEAPL